MSFGTTLFPIGRPGRYRSRSDTPTNTDNATDDTLKYDTSDHIIKSLGGDATDELTERDHIHQAGRAHTITPMKQLGQLLPNNTCEEVQLKIASSTTDLTRMVVPLRLWEPPPITLHTAHVLEQVLLPLVLGYDGSGDLRDPICIQRLDLRATAWRHRASAY